VIWLALVFLLAVLVAGSVHVARSGLDTYRAARGALGAIGRETEAALGRLDAAPQHLDNAAAAGARLSAALTRLSRDRTRLTLLLDALADVRASVRGVFAFVPRR
jgi:hypothetical protein